MNLSGSLAAYFRQQRWNLAVNPGEVNIVYIEGANEDGSPRENKPNQFNDRRIVFTFVNGAAAIVHNALATSEPGAFYTEQPMDRRGAARIALGQHPAAWRVGIHQPSKPSGHEALVQCAKVRIHRDFNKDYQRSGDPVVSELIGLDQHRAYGNAKEDIGRASAGCLVAWNTAGHQKFISLVKADPRYRASSAFAFDTTVIEAGELMPYLTPRDL